MKVNTLLPKGHPVTYRVPLRGYEWYKTMLRREGISWAEDDNFLYLKAFVAEDTYKKGFSVVAVENERKCIISVRPEAVDAEKAREFLRYHQDIRMGEISAFNYKHYPHDGGGSPVCQYSGGA